MKSIKDITKHIFLIYEGKPTFTANATGCKTAYTYTIDSTRIPGGTGFLLTHFGSFTHRQHVSVIRNADFHTVFYGNMFYHTLTPGVMAIAIVQDDSGQYRVRELLDCPADIEYCASIME
jgi:hypothetical protein